ncbi:MAG TPA: hypothetical protein VLK79_11100, partial [Gaiellales bacterium]|nr:hypothetical protein [Gaiellales bacterium]
EEGVMQRNAWSGWISFAGWLMVIIGSIDAVEGLIAIIRGTYYVVSPQQIIVFDLKTWDGSRWCGTSS